MQTVLSLKFPFFRLIDEFERPCFGGLVSTVFDSQSLGLGFVSQWMLQTISVSIDM